MIVAGYVVQNPLNWLVGGFWKVLEILVTEALERPTL